MSVIFLFQGMWSCFITQTTLRRPWLSVLTSWNKTRKRHSQNMSGNLHYTCTINPVYRAVDSIWASGHHVALKVKSSGHFTSRLVHLWSFRLWSVAWHYDNWRAESILPFVCQICLCYAFYRIKYNDCLHIFSSWRKYSDDPSKAGFLTWQMKW